MIDLIYVAHNRLEFTRKTFETLLENTNLKLVSTVTVYDDMSEDGTSEYLENKCSHNGFQYIRKPYHSVVKVMREAIEKCGARYLAKIDNDTMVPKFWLDICVETLERNPKVDLLGIEAMRGGDPWRYTPRECELAPHIGGIGLMRHSAFERCGLPKIQADQRHGFTEWQHDHIGEVTPAWLVPSLPVCLLDHVPLEPWRHLSQEYVNRGWQRNTWGEYRQDQSYLWEWWCESSAL